MKMSILGQTLELAIRNNIVLLVANVLMAICLVMSVAVNLSVHERIVLVPPYMDKKMDVSWKSANADYYKAWGLYATTLVGNVTPKTVNFVADAIGFLLHPSIYPKIRAQIKSLADDPVFQKANAINYFVPHDITYEVDADKKQKVFVAGQLITSSFEAPNALTGARSDYKSVIYEMTFESSDGRPVIVDMTSYPGNQPHTIKWWASQQPSQVNKADTQQESQEVK